MTKPTRPTVPKLGELLEARGKLDREGLFRAMRHQRAHGGRLGTSLIELGLVSEDDVLHVLSDQLKLPFASPEDLRAIPDEAKKLVPAKVALSRLAVPLRASSAKLDVAMANPKDLAALDELAFVSGRRIVPLVATELRIHEALARAYGVDIPGRFVKLLDRQNRERYFWGRDAESAPAAAPEAALTLAPPTPSAPLAVPPQAPAPPPPAPPAPVAPPPPAPVAPPPPAAVVAPPPPAPVAAPPAPPAAMPPAAAPAGPVSREAIELRLNEPADRDAVATSVVDFLRGRFERALLLMVRRDEAVGWAGFGAGASAEPGDVQIPLAEPSVVVALRDGAPQHRGGLAPLPAHDPLERWLSARNAVDLLALPLRVRDKLVGVVLVANQGAAFDPTAVDDLQRVAQRAATALEFLVLRQKLRRS